MQGLRFLFEYLAVVLLLSAAFYALVFMAVLAGKTFGRRRGWRRTEDQGMIASRDLMDCTVDRVEYRIRAWTVLVRYHVTAVEQGEYGNDYVDVFQHGVGLDDISTRERRKLLNGGQIVMIQKFRLRETSSLELRWREPRRK